MIAFISLIVILFSNVAMFNNYNAKTEKIEVAVVSLETKHREHEDVLTSRSASLTREKTTYPIFNIVVSNGEILSFSDYDLAINTNEYILNNTKGLTTDIVVEKVDNLEGFCNTSQDIIDYLVKRYPIITTHFPADSRVINSYYGNRPSLHDFHKGIDLYGNSGDNIYAYKKGVVVEAGWSNRGYGNNVVIDHGNGMKTRYAHMSRILVNYGQYVDCGQIIGLIGHTGYAYGDHLHFEVIINDNQVNPYNYIF